MNATLPDLIFVTQSDKPQRLAWSDLFLWNRSWGRGRSSCVLQKYRGEEWAQPIPLGARRLELWRQGLWQVPWIKGWRGTKQSSVPTCCDKEGGDVIGWGILGEELADFP